MLKKALKDDMILIYSADACGRWHSYHKMLVAKPDDENERGSAHCNQIKVPRWSQSNFESLSNNSMGRIIRQNAGLGSH